MPTSKAKEPSSTKAESRKKGRKAKRGVSRKGLLAGMFVAVVLAIVAAMAGYVAVIYKGHQYLNANVEKMEMDESSIIYDINKKEVTTLSREHREIAEFQEIPELLRSAFIATEDKRFNEHTGVDLWAIGRALYKDILHRSAVEGGSTITQQLAKNLFLDFDKTIFRKATEASIAMALEQELSKDEILELYLNRIYFGKGVYGVKTAAKYYFGVTDMNKDLKLWQIATLAGIPKNPGQYNPVSNPEKSKERRAVVLKLMYDQGLISESQKNEAAAVDYVPPKRGEKSDNLAFIDYVLVEAQETAGLTEDQLRRGGYQIYTTMDSKAQKIAEDTFNNPNFFQKDMHNQKIQGSMVILNNQDGGIVAMIGGRDYVAKGTNRALSQRQPGSSFKPIVVYTPALEDGRWNPYSQLVDEKMDFNGYSPNNYDGVYRGKASMFESVRRSLNVPAVWLLSQMGPAKGLEYAKRFGMELDPKDRNLAIALGGLTRGVSPLQMAQAYTAFPNHGSMQKAHSIVRIVNKNGKDQYAFKAEKPKPVMSEKTAWYMTQMLQDAVQNGTGARAKMDRPVAGKTGSTGLDLKGLEKYDSNVWFVGFTPEWTAAVWMGFDRNTDDKGNRYYVTVGSGATAAIFKEVMTKSLAGRKVVQFVKPKDVPELVEPKAPTAVSDLKAELVQDARGSSVKLTWTGAAAEEGISYSLYRKSSKDTEFKELLKAASPPVDDMLIQAGETYQYYVIAYRAESGMEGEKSNIVEVAVSENGLTIPLNPLEPVLPGIPGRNDGGTGAGGTGNGGTGTGNGGTGTGGTGNGGAGTGGIGTGGAGAGGTGTGGTGTGGTGTGGTGTGTGTGGTGTGGTGTGGTGTGGTGTGGTGTGGTGSGGTGTGGTGTGGTGTGGTGTGGTGTGGTGTGGTGTGGTDTGGTGTGGTGTGGTDTGEAGTGASGNSSRQDRLLPVLLP
jgi:penicillin-binding protein 2A